jgi:acyl-CoA synthetase (AMP-forming)/AMP-acid ligase II
MFKDNDNFILLSAPSSYQFLVALFAILAIGGAAVLLRMSQLVWISTSPILGSDSQALSHSAWYRSRGNHYHSSEMQCAGVCLCARPSNSR